jgi:hypothetical protein
MRTTLALTMLAGTALVGQAPGPVWLDRPLTNWNTPGRAVPVAKPEDESIAELSARCSYQPLLRSTPGERALADAGWVPFRVNDRQIAVRDVEIVGGLAGADGMCRPVDFNVFVFVNGQLAGTLSPEEMVSRTDATLSGAIRIASDETITAGFSRYTDKDALCCPSSHVTIRYRIDRTVMPPTVVPLSIRVTRP